MNVLFYPSNKWRSVCPSIFSTTVDQIDFRPVVLIAEDLKKSSVDFDADADEQLFGNIKKRNVKRQSG